MVDGRISPGEWSDATRVAVAVSDTWSAPALSKHDGRHLYVALDNLSSGGARLSPELLVAARALDADSWQQGHWWLHASHTRAGRRRHSATVQLGCRVTALSAGWPATT